MMWQVIMRHHVVITPARIPEIPNVKAHGMIPKEDIKLAMGQLSVSGGMLTKMYVYL